MNIALFVHAGQLTRTVFLGSVGEIAFNLPAPEQAVGACTDRGDGARMQAFSAPLCAGVVSTEQGVVHSDPYSGYASPVG